MSGVRAPLRGAHWATERLRHASDGGVLSASQNFAAVNFGSVEAGLPMSGARARWGRVVAAVVVERSMREVAMHALSVASRAPPSATGDKAMCRVRQRRRITVMVKRALVGVVVLLALAVFTLYALFQRSMSRASARLEGRSRVVSSPWGDVEYVEGEGGGVPVLVLHGSGGGFDQGELVARAVLPAGARWLAPSRFGYLRSTFTPGATFDEQAHAYAALLDRLAVPKVHVVALSHGGPSALLFAVLHPDRVASLTLLSAGVAASSDPAQAQANQQGDALARIFQSDFAYWAVTTALRGWFLGLMGAPPPVVARLTPAQRALADDVIEYMNPVSRRAAGVTFDNRAAMPNERIAAIRAPTLVLHARDDTLQLFHNAEYAAAHIGGARLEAFDHGGHLLVAVEQDRVRALVSEHLAAAEAVTSPRP